VKVRKRTVFLVVVLAVLASVYGAYCWWAWWMYSTSHFDYSNLPPGLHVSHGPPFHEDPPWYFYDRPFHPSVVFYRTEVKNTTDRPIRITSFSAFRLRGDTWTKVPTVRGMNPTGKVFAEWFGKESIEPGGIAVCYTNYSRRQIKWAYEGIDEAGRTYHAAAVVEWPTE